MALLRGNKGINFFTIKLHIYMKVAHYCKFLDKFVIVCFFIVFCSGGYGTVFLSKIKEPSLDGS